MESHKQLLLANKAWVKEKLSLKPDYFTAMARDQKPDFLWIGCSDSRVPAEEITGTQPGEIFVHRNIANLVVSTDFNLLSVVQYAIEYLKVKHIIVCGHYGCGGVQAALSQNRFGLLNQWLRNIKDIYDQNAKQFVGIPTEKEKWEKLVELNVKEQVLNLARTSIVQEAWKQASFPVLHGWVYGLNDGLLKELIQIENAEQLAEIYRFRFGG